MAERTPSPAMTASARTHVLLAAAACLLPPVSYTHLDVYKRQKPTQLNAHGWRSTS